MSRWDSKNLEQQAVITDHICHHPVAVRICGILSVLIWLVSAADQK
ncbi:hypothetical protein [Parasphaerochaeta coccoides]|nr:hypothetical protein [Parasphaerochaeta coccoides]